MNTVLIILAILVAIPIFVLALEVLFALLPKRKMTTSVDSRPTITILIPAYNESGTIQSTLININKQLVKNDRLLVVADNCTDNTSSIAKEYGAEVVERIDTNKRGKGYALDYGIRYLEKDPTQVVIIVDADCLVDEGGLELLAKLTITTNRPVQGDIYMFYNKPVLKQRISEFAWLVKNYIRPTGLYNIGMPCQLMGTGMAFPWEIIVNAKLATSNIVEDMKMGLDMAALGHAPMFCPNVRINSMFPETATAEQSQKKRWEHGHMSMITSVVPGSMLVALKQHSMSLFIMTLDIIVPPLALLGLFVSMILIVTLIYAFITESFISLIISTLSITMYTGVVLLAWLQWGRKIISLADLLRVPYYIFGKIPLYIAYVFKRQKEWIRTKRD